MAITIKNMVGLVCDSCGKFIIFVQMVPTTLREIGQGGLAATPTVRQLEAKNFGMPIKTSD